jgi:hypothetical protein
MTFGGSATIPAGGHVDVPLAFEGATSAAITVMVPNEQVTGTFGATALVPQAFGPLRYLSVELTKPADGSLRLSNAGEQPADVTTVVMILTDRHLTVEAAVFAKVGAPLEVTFSVAGAIPGDVPTAQLVDPTGAMTPIDLVPAGPARWTATVLPAVPGRNRIMATLAGSRPRSGAATVDVGARDSAISTTIAESTLDTDGDGLIDSLVISPTVTAHSTGTYTLVANLVDAAGVEISNGRAEVQLTADVAQRVDLPFDGAWIYKSGHPGPYHLVDLALFTDSIGFEAKSASTDPTAAYSLAAFKHDFTTFDARLFHVAAIDDDRDGIPDKFRVTGSITVDGAGSYELLLDVVTAGGSQVANLTSDVPLAGGPNTFSLDVPAPTAGAPAGPGPYAAELLMMYESRFDPLRSFVISAPASAAVGLITVPVRAWFPAGWGTVEIWQRTLSDAAGTDGGWAMVATTTGDSDTIISATVPVAAGAGKVELYSIAVDGASGAREPAPAGADTTTRVGVAPAGLPGMGPTPAP